MRDPKRETSTLFLDKNVAWLRMNVMDGASESGGGSRRSTLEEMIKWKKRKMVDRTRVESE